MTEKQRQLTRSIALSFTQLEKAKTDLLTLSYTLGYVGGESLSDISTDSIRLADKIESFLKSHTLQITQQTEAK